MDGLTTPKTHPAAIIPSDDRTRMVVSREVALERFACRLPAMLEWVVVMTATVPGVPVPSHGCDHPSRPSGCELGGKFYPGVQSALTQHAGDMVLDSPRTQEQRGRDLAIGQPFGDEDRHPGFL